MKAHLFLIVFLFVSFTVFAQESNIPKAIKDSFSKHYPKVTTVKWDKESAKEFEASFKDNGKSISVVLDEKGNINETETVIQISELPKSAVTFVEKNYPGYKISEAAKILDSKGVETFEAEITKDKVKKDLLFDSKGNAINKNANKENEREEEEDGDKD